MKMINRQLFHHKKAVINKTPRRIMMRRSVAFVCVMPNSMHVFQCITLYEIRSAGTKAYVASIILGTTFSVPNSADINSVICRSASVCLRR